MRRDLLGKRRGKFSSSDHHLPEFPELFRDLVSVRGQVVHEADRDEISVRIIVNGPYRLVKALDGDDGGPAPREPYPRKPGRRCPRIVRFLFHEILEENND